MEHNFFSDGLRGITYNELLNSNVRDAVTEKLDALKPGDVAQRIIYPKAKLLHEMFMATLQGDYKGLSLYGLCRVALTLDYFMRTRDAKPDTQAGGFDDDREEVEKAYADLKSEIEAYKAWLAAQPKDI